MRCLGIRMPFLAAIMSLGLSLSAWAMDLGYRETVYLWPTTTITTIPTTYVPRAYYVPSAYVVPSSYLTTTYLSDSILVEPAAYVETAYRTGLFRRRWVVERSLVAAYETTYLPTTYVVPTYYTTTLRSRRYVPTVYEVPAVWETAYLAPTTIDCDEVVWSQAAPASRSSTAKSPGSSTSSRSVKSELSDDAGISSNVPPAPADAAAARAMDQTATPRSAVGTVKDTSPPPPAVERERVTAPPANTPAKAAHARRRDQGQGDPRAAKLRRRTGLCPAIRRRSNAEARLAEADLLDRHPARAAQRARRHSPNRSGRSREEVGVTVSSRANTAIRREGLTDAFGTFAIRLTDGEWTVSVRMPSGRLYPVRTVTVTDGKVVDNRERREVVNLVISY